MNTAYLKTIGAGILIILGCVVFFPPHPVHSDDGLVTAIAWKPDGLAYAVGYSNNMVDIYDAAGTLIHSYSIAGNISWVSDNPLRVTALEWSPNGGELAVAATTRRQDAALVRVIDPDTGQTTFFRMAGHGCNHVAWSPDGTLLANTTMPAEYASPVNRIEIWDVLANQSVVNLGQVTYGHNQVTSMAWSPDGTKLASSFDRSVIIWSAPYWTLYATLPHDSDVLAVDWSPDSARLATASSDGSIRLWDVASSTLIETLVSETEHGMMVDVDWHPTREWLAGAAGQEIQLWDMSGYRPIMSPITHPERHILSLVEWSPDGTHLLYGGHMSNVEYLDVRSLIGSE